MEMVLHNLTDCDIKLERSILKKVFKSISNEKNIQIILVSKEEIRRMNHLYRNKDYATDVLSFINDSDIESLGDCFISVEKAKEQAIENNHSYERELAFLAVHGYLHLIGYDHETKEEENEMVEIQERILKNVGLERK